MEKKESEEYPEKSKYFPYDMFGHYIGGRVLEIGCAEGNNTGFLIEKFNIRRMVCLELDISRLKKARQKNDALFVNADARFLPFKPEVFDAVYCSEVLEHLPAREEHKLLVMDMRRVLKEGKYAIITTPNRPVYTLFRWLTLKKNDPGHSSEICYFRFRRLIKGVFNDTMFIGIFGIFGSLIRHRFFRGLHRILMGWPAVCKASVAICHKE